MNDREVLELAAKAAGIRCRWWNVKQWVNRENNAGEAKYYAGSKKIFGTHHAKPWNPLTDDGDALRLAVKLEMNLFLSKTECIAEFGSNVKAYENNYDGSASRRAIVRAAAEIGKAMP
jgi:hypothetical protein